MKSISENELLCLKGGKTQQWSDCDLVIMAGNMADESWTDDMWESWYAAFDRNCR